MQQRWLFPMTSAGYTLNEIIELLTVDMMRKKVVAVGGGGPVYFINMADCFFYFVGVGSFGSGFVDDLREQLSCCFCMHFTIINHFVIDENNLIIKTNAQSTLFLQSFQVLEYLLILFFVNL